MITNSLPHTKSATFQVLVPHPDPEYKEFPTPMGTGFFVSPDGYFISARHVLINDKNGTFFDLKKVRLTKPDIFPSPHIISLDLVEDFPQFDICLLKADFERAKNQEYYKGKDGFGYLDIDFKVPAEGTDVYSFGYPLSKISVNESAFATTGFHYSGPRTTSAIISSHFEVIGPMMVMSFPIHYVIDKALNYGNSGGPLILQENGKVISLCSRFQPVVISQASGDIAIPSLYGITTSLKNIEGFLLKYL